MASQELTQPTQQVLDPRRLGKSSSGLSDNDTADVLLFLSGATPAAIRIAQNTADNAPHHVMYTDATGSYYGPSQDIEEQETIIIDKNGKRQGRGTPEIALRLSNASRLKSKSLMFVFGRNASMSDIVLGTDSGRRISNQHFRIFINSEGLTMLEDMSTNGTIVDTNHLRGKDSRFDKCRMLVQGSDITVASSSDDIIRFHVRFPARSSYVQIERFEENLQAFMAECTAADDTKRQRPFRAHSKWNGGEKYTIIGEIGKGAFATVYTLATKMDGRVLAAKELEKRRFMKNGQLDKKIDNEMRIMAGLQHENIIQFVEYHDQGDYLYIIMEYARCGDMLGYLKKNGPLPEETAKSFARQVFSGLSYLHRNNVTHRDIKPDNILIASEEPLLVKISDFGLSKMVQQDETFLKTFCGTLLYCAPEVFPPYSSSSSHGTKRQRGAANKKYNAYSSSVDMWSFGAVLWFVLCEKPPFEGISDATGEAMYYRIMTTTLDPTPLQEKGISEVCIDLLSKMLCTDPAKRLTESGALKHPWLKGDGAAPLSPGLQSIIEEDEYEYESEDAEQRLSQLQIEDEAGEDISDESKEILSDPEFGNLLGDRQAKRVRIDTLFPRNQVRDYDEDSSSADVSFQSAEEVMDESFPPQRLTGKQRLFGEIGQSALQSSGILSAHANQALSDATSTVSGAQADGSFVGQKARGRTQQQTAPSRDVTPYDGALLSSLLGAESLVRELNMASPGSSGSGQQSPIEPATPKTPDVPQHSSLNQSQKYSSQSSEPTPRPRQPNPDRQIVLPLTASRFFAQYDSNAHDSQQPEGSNWTRQDDGAEGSIIADTVTQSGSADDSDAAAPIVQDPPSDAFPRLPSELNIRPPPRRLGKLTATRDSFAHPLVLHLEKSRTSWGRLAANTIVYEDRADTRIPKTAFIIFWWSSSVGIHQSVQQLSQNDQDWTKLDDLHVGIFTCARQGIAVNGTHIRQVDENGRAIYGHLHSGDVIQVYANPHNNECLKFTCDFYLGSGKHPRPTGDNFKALLGGKLPV